jgi:hypothetical protein
MPHFSTLFELMMMKIQLSESSFRARWPLVSPFFDFIFLVRAVSEQDGSLFFSVFFDPCA